MQTIKATHPHHSHPRSLSSHEETQMAGGTLSMSPDLLFTHFSAAQHSLTSTLSPLTHVGLPEALAQLKYCLWVWEALSKSALQCLHQPPDLTLVDYSTVSICI